MMASAQGLQAQSLQCPYCGEQIEVLIDCSVDSQEYTEDCSVCCRPIILCVESGDAEVLSLEARTEDE